MAYNYKDPLEPATHGIANALDPNQVQRQRLRTYGRFPADQLREHMTDDEREYTRGQTCSGPGAGAGAGANPLAKPAYPPSGLLHMIEFYSTTLSNLESAIKSLYARLEPIYVDRRLEEEPVTAADAAPALPVSPTVAHLQSLNYRLDVAIKALRQIEAGLNL